MPTFPVSNKKSVTIFQIKKVNRRSENLKALRFVVVLALIMSLFSITSFAGSMDFYIDNWENTTRMGQGTYQFKLSNQTRYTEASEYVIYLSKSEFINSRGPVLYITVINGVVSELC